MRLKAAGDLMGGRAKTIMQSLRDQLARGEPVEIAGYQLSPGLASGMEQATVSPPVAKDAAQRVEWFELTSRDDATLSPVASQAIAQWQQAGYSVTSHLVNGSAFWQTIGIEDAPALVASTRQVLCN